MAKSVVIVEAAAKAKTLEDQFGGEVETILVQAAPAKATCVPPKDHLHREKPHFDFVAESKEKLFLDKLLACQGREIYLALDGDWRGEFWAWLISGYWATVAPGSKQPQRLGLIGLAGEALRESFRRVEPVSDEKGAATYVKMLFESYLGRHLQRLLGSRSGPNGLPLNYLSLTTLSLLAERETEIRMYTPVAKWKVKVKISTEAGDCVLKLEEAYGVTDDGFLRNEKEVHTAINLFNNAAFQVREVTGSPLAIAPPGPYHLMDLLRDGVAQGGLSPLAAMTAIRNLYYGVEVDGRRIGLVTAFLPPAMEQDSSVLFAKIREQIGKRLGAGSLGPESSQENTQGLILPTEPALGPEELSGKLGAAEDKIYRLVWARALASQMKEAQGELLAVTVEAGEDCIFEGSAKVLSDKGFLAIYPGCQEHELLAPPSPLAKVQAGQPLRCIQIIPEKNIGVPPEYYSFEGLAADLGDFSLEIDGMTVAMLQQMLDSNYLRMMPDGSFRCAENTIKLVSVMNRAFPTMKGVHLSAYLAQTIEEAVSGRKTLAFALQQFDQTVMMRGEVLVKMTVPIAAQKRGISSRSVIRLPGEGEPAKAQDAGGPAPVPAEKAELPAEPDAPVPPEAGMEAAAAPEPAVEPAPEDAAQAVQAGEGVASGGAETAEPQREEAGPGKEEEQEPIVLEEPAAAEQAVTPELAAATEKMFAEAAISIDEPLPATEVSPALEPKPTAAEPAKACPDCNRPLLLKEDRFGKYWYCSGHPECRYSASYEKDGGPGQLCPVCRIGTVVTKHTPTGKLFYVCPEQDCEFMAWSKPHAIPCQVCDSPFLVEKKGLDGRLSLRCPRAGCTFTRALSGAGGAEQASAAAAPVKKKVLVRRVAPGSASAGGATKKVRIVRRKK